MKKKYKTPAAMKKKITKYFDGCFINDTDADGKSIILPNGEFRKVCIRPPTVTGLCDFLNLTRKTLLEYEKQEAFCDIIAAAKNKIECYAEEELYRNTNRNASGVMFNLRCNFGWSESATLSSDESAGVVILPDVNQDGE